MSSRAERSRHAWAAAASVLTHIAALVWILVLVPPPAKPPLSVRMQLERLPATGQRGAAPGSGTHSGEVPPKGTPGGGGPPAPISSPYPPRQPAPPPAPVVATRPPPPTPPPVSWPARPKRKRPRETPRDRDENRNDPPVPMARPAPSTMPGAGIPGTGHGTGAPAGHPRGTAGGRGGSPAGKGLTTSGSGTGAGGTGTAASPPSLVDFHQPEYPASARRSGHEGRVLVEVRVSPGGTASAVRVVSSSGHPDLDEAALDALRRARYQPARAGDQPVAGTKTVSIVFNLEN